MLIVRFVILAFALHLAAPALAQDKLTLALGQRGNWDTAVSELGQRIGLFKKHGLVLDILWTQGAGESQQAVLAGGADLGLFGTLQTFAAYKKGVPVRIVAAEATGAADFWYARADSAVRSMKDTEGKTVAYSTNGASTHTMVLGFIKQFGVAAKPVATGSPSATLTQVMSGQIDVADLASVRDQTVRVLVGLADRIDARPAVIARYVQAYRETVDWMYAGEEPLKMYAEFASVSLEIARQVRDQFFPKSLLVPDKVTGLDALMADGVAFKYIAEPLTSAQLNELIRVPPPPK